jgi:hypothetical protein
MGQDNTAGALVVVVAIVIIALCACGAGGRRGGGCGGKGQFAAGEPPGPPLAHPYGRALDISHGYPYGHALDTVHPAGAAENRMYSTAEVDPLVTGQLYSGARAAGPGQRMIYGGRTSHGDKWGMHEFSAGVPGQAGVDVGPLGMREYSLDGGPGVFDDGIPENWQMPSTPMNWYAPQGRDFYDVEARGPGVYDQNLMSLTEPDHEPMIN